MMHKRGFLISLPVISLVPDGSFSFAWSARLEYQHCQFLLSNKYRKKEFQNEQDFNKLIHLWTYSLNWRINTRVMKNLNKEFFFSDNKFSHTLHSKVLPGNNGIRWLHIKIFTTWMVHKTRLLGLGINAMNENVRPKAKMKPQFSIHKILKTSQKNNVQWSCGWVN